jgi:CRP/FNR family transcriptional regulator
MGSINQDRFLEIFPFFKNASQPLVDNILSSASCKKLPGKMLVSLEGDHCQNFFLMLSGEKRIFKMGGSEREITLYEIGPGDICILNASCILSNTRFPAHVITTCETEILLLPAHQFLDMIAKYDDMRKFIHSQINAGFASLMALISEVAFGKMDERLTDYLIEKSENSKLKRTHQQIANDLGTSREVISRLLKEFERQGLILLSRNFIELKKL